MSNEMLYQSPWVSLLMVRAPELGVDGYVYSHETRCAGRIVALLPFRQVQYGALEFLLKSEMTPCWQLGQQTLSSITGGYEGGQIEDDAIRELLEETGYTATTEELIPLGTSYASKSADTVYSLFSVELTDRTAEQALGDGSRLESESQAIWVSEAQLLTVQDPQVSVMFLRFLNAGWHPILGEN